jgi:glucose/arabinose dehydrogenase
MVAFMGNSTILAAAGQIQNQRNPSPYSRISLDADSRGLTDPNLRLEVVARGLNTTTAMAFLGNSSNDILVTEQNTGKVRRIIDGRIQQEPLIDVAVANGNRSNGRGLLGMAVIDAFDNQTAATSGNSSKVAATTTYVFLYFTESGGGEDGDDNRGVVPAGSRLYRYELQEDDEGAKLVNPKLLLDLPARPGPRHYGGTILATYEDVSNSKTISIYLMVGNVEKRGSRGTQALNHEDGALPDGTSGILRLDMDGNPLPYDEPASSDNNNSNVENGKDEGMLQYYYAYGIRNSFGMDFDPVTGNLWDTENGPEFGDEINLVEPGFNSGFADVMGLMSKLEENIDQRGLAVDDIEDVELVDFDGRGNYSDPEFVWHETVAPTAIKFLDSTKLGAQYENDLFVGDFKSALLYHFDLNEGRTALALSGELADKVADSPDELDGSGVIFGRELRVTDLEVGPDDGYLYVLTLFGTLYRVVPGEE